MRNLPMDLLRTFVKIADLRSFTRAGIALGRTQPAISLQMARLESLVGVKLLTRSGGEIELSEAGENLVHYARQILCLNDEAVSRLTQQSVRGTVRVGLPNDFAVAFLSEILGGFAKSHESISLDVKCDLSVQLLAALEQNEMDVVIAMTSEDPRHPAAKVWKEKLVWVTGPESDTHRRDPIALVAYPQGCVYRRSMVNGLNLCERAWRIVYSSPNLSGLLAAVEAGLGITVLSEKTAPARLRRLGEADGLPTLPTVQVGLYYRADGLSSAASHLVNHMISSFDRSHATADDAMQQPIALPTERRGKARLKTAAGHTAR